MKTGVKENAIFMKEVEDGMKVQKQILERLEAANSILLSRKRGNEILDNSKEYGLLKNADLLKMDHMTKEEMDRFNERYNEYSQIIKKNDEDDNKEIEKLLHWVIIGGGPTGVELVAEISDFVREDASKYFPLISKRVKITLLEAGEKILSNFDSSLSTYARTQLESRGAEVLCGTMVTKITKDFVEIKQEIVGKTNFLTTQIPYGCIIWAGGIATRPITKAIAVQIGDTQSSRWGLEVDAKLKVKGVESDKIWALGDCAVCGLAPTAQTASQQGKYLGKMFRDTKLQIKEVEKYPDFSFKNKGSLAYLGNGKGIAEIKGLWDQYPTDETNRVEGHAAFAIWRSLYFSKLMSSRNQAAVAFDWVKTSIFGRDISTTHNIDTST
jgi:NADH:ubiquinone reductase (non-electrogenic)